MPDWVEVMTQEELDRALLRSNVIPTCIGEGSFSASVPKSGIVRAADSVTLEASGSGTVEAWGTAMVIARGELTVGAWQSARAAVAGNVTVEAWNAASVEARGSCLVRMGGSATVRAYDRSHVEAVGSATVYAHDQVTVVASGSAAIHAGGCATVRAWQNSTVRAFDSAGVRAWGYATVEAWGNARVHAWDATTIRAGGAALVRAWGSASVRARGDVVVEASDQVSVIRHGHKPRVTGGVVTDTPLRLTNPQQWCSFYGVDVEDGVATLYKAVDDAYTSAHGTTYVPGSQPQAEDWDGGARECGSGLHFSPTPAIALQFAPRATRFVACPVRLGDMVVQGRPMGAGKVKAKGTCGPVYEVDEAGRPLPPG